MVETRKDEYQPLRDQYGMIASFAIAELRKETTPLRVRVKDLAMLCELLSTPSLYAREKLRQADMTGLDADSITRVFTRLTGCIV